jgi:hypothetical protein
MPNSLFKVAGAFVLVVCHVLGADVIFPPKPLNVNGLNARQIYANPNMYDVQGYWAWLIVGRANPDDSNSSFFRSTLTFTNNTADTSVSCSWVLYNQRGAEGGDVKIVWKSDNWNEVTESQACSYPVQPFSSRTIEFISPSNGGVEFHGYARVQCYSENLETVVSGVSATGTVRHYSPEGDLMSELFNNISFVKPTNKWTIPLEVGKTEATLGSQTTRSNWSDLGVAVALTVPGSPQYTGGDYVSGPVRIRMKLRDQYGTTGATWEGLWQNGLDYPHAMGEVKGLVLSQIFGDRLFFPDQYGNQREKIFGTLEVEAFGQTAKGEPISIVVLANRSTDTLDGRRFWVSPPAMAVPVESPISDADLEEILK